jgi:hypothetical protein
MLACFCSLLNAVEHDIFFPPNKAILHATPYKACCVPKPCSKGRVGVQKVDFAFAMAPGQQHGFVKPTI